MSVLAPGRQHVAIGNNVDRLLIEKSAEELKVPPRIGARECSFWLLVPL
jgi:hypothetical protein